jgi:hypothetical protein
MGESLMEQYRVEEDGPWIKERRGEEKRSTPKIEDKQKPN